ncbi:hypothetical protein RR48_07178 [Papilio machaon]|uniref:Ionotropic glutamate receptor L-glutamate and glycine-binding domain-containing protein n=1 Tax=Papilio machaon TaxID=76193 RepID=A0A194RJT1_PAPMA|nr:hypothetical protein RR48_07178 [Papilio machaon]
MTNENFSQTAKSAECVLKLSAKYFVEKKALSGSIVVININSYASTTQSLLLQTINGGMKYSVMVKDSTFPHANATHFPEKAKNYLLILEDKSELTRNILQVHQLPSWNPLAKAVVYYQLRTGEVGENVAMDFINELRTYKLLKSIVLIHDAFEDEVISYSWRPYTDTNCGGECDSVYVLDTCKDGNFVEGEQLRNIIPIDMKGCPLIVHAIVAEPYVMSPSRKISKYADIYEFDMGGEINLIKTIAEFTNMSLYIFMSEKEENWGTINRNGTATGAYALLRNDSIDLMIGNIEVTRRLRKWFHPTTSYTQDEMTWCVPRAKQAATWDNLLIIFQWPTWIAINYEVTTFSEGVRRAAFDRNFAVVSSRRQAEYQDQNLGKGTSYIYCFPESDNLYKYSVVLLARKWFPILDRFNSIIRSVTENGLIEKWNRELFIHRSNVESVGTILPMSIQHLLGAFAFILIMYVLSTLIFISELFLGYINRRKLIVKAIYPFQK